MKDNIIKNLKKFVFEFVIVTLGILTAFSINKWDENNKLDTEEQSSYKALKNDLLLDLYVLNYYKQVCVKGNTYLKPVLELNFKEIDSLEFYLQAAFDLQEGGATYTNLKYSGKLDIIKNEEIKGGLIMYYETYYQGLENVSRTNYGFNSNFINPYFINHLKYNFTTEDLRNELQKDEFLNLIKKQNELLEYNVSSIEKSEALVNALLEKINAEIVLKEVPDDETAIATPS